MAARAHLPNAIAAEAREARVDVLKIDIEGAEHGLFESKEFTSCSWCGWTHAIGCRLTTAWSQGQEAQPEKEDSEVSCTDLRSAPPGRLLAASHLPEWREVLFGRTSPPLARPPRAPKQAKGRVRREGLRDVFDCARMLSQVRTAQAGTLQLRAALCAQCSSGLLVLPTSCHTIPAFASSHALSLYLDTLYATCSTRIHTPALLSA